ncbi:rRNA pseudouridine synthase [Phragmitibacter flavus]|uniref:Pseudouridine synthase n=1 Tax=Phragmitibacter flavus TaxID=2576071 RepID=A0A5R8K9F8_9BACT|nr:rRNA pseudouridine synthase [Phragmitibacter flavus]
MARTLSKLGFCSRRAAGDLARAGRIRVNGVVRRDPEFAIKGERDQIQVDGVPVTAAKPVYVMLNKPRGLVTSASDEQGRSTVFECFAGSFAEVHLAPVGRLDKASEGLLLFTNDTGWAESITSPLTHVEKVYHVQVDRVLDADQLQRLRQPVENGGERLVARAVNLLRHGPKNSWVEFTLDEGRNRHLRRLCEAHGLEVLRLVRVKVGSLGLGELTKGAWRHLTTEEVGSLVPGG